MAGLSAESNGLFQGRVEIGMWGCSQHDGAVQYEQRHALAGESWSQGQVILSWDDALQGASAVGDGRNVVIHEFAHQLDQENGDANGAPYLGGGAARLQRWSQVLGDAFAQLRPMASCVMRPKLKFGSNFASINSLPCGILPSPGPCLAKPSPRA